MHSLIIYLQKADWIAAIAGSITTLFAVGLRLVLKAPFKALASTARFIRTFSFASPQRPFDGTWRITWKVESTRLHETNSDDVRIYVLFGNVTFTTKTTLRNGEEEACLFIGKLEGRTLTGRWLDPKDPHRAYFGVYQVQLHGGLRHGAGAWLGWTNDGPVQANDMTMDKIAESS